jgi:small-conductance mechanosensitive channel
VLPDHPVEVLFLEYLHSARLVRVRWWIDNMLQEWYVVDRVNEALEIAFEKAGIEMPVTTRDLIVKLEAGGGEEISHRPGELELPGRASNPPPGPPG